MSKEAIEKLYVCTACGEEYTGKTRKWTCPICGNADTYEEEKYGLDDYDKDYDEDYDDF